MLARMAPAFAVLLLGLGVSLLGLGAELRGVTTTLCNSNNTKCLRILAERSSQSHYNNIFTFRKVVVEKVGTKQVEEFKATSATLDMTNQKLTILQKLDSRTAKEIQFDLRTLDQKEFLVN